ncbi:MAG: galactokinase [Prevotellaceae bacterium]|jgi:galactokinase/galacturonokinase|nr:galactokinase [Prevotellaceae bacterium]
MIATYQDFLGDSKNIKKIFSPYRVCPLGAHVDHQHGLVTGFAINKGVEFWFAPTAEETIDIRSLTFEGAVTIDLQQRLEARQGNWGDYVRGAVYALRKRFVLQHGIRGVIKGSLPIGGLSSSAAVLVAYVNALAEANGIMLKKMEVINITSEAEREYVGLNNGVLDQACVTLSKKNHLLYFDTDNNNYRLLPKNAEMPEFEIGIFFSGLTRSLISSDYNLRVNECKTAAWDILAFKELPLNIQEKTFLRDIPEEFYLETKAKLPPRFARRAEHFYSECKRVRMGVSAWERGDLHAFGNLILESCESSVKNYECGSPELIALYEIMRETAGIYGGRFSGAGFKGACVALINPEYKQTIEQEVTAKYLEKFPQYKDSFEVHFCEINNGAEFVQSTDYQNIE